jgi:hypothetical protein
MITDIFHPALDRRTFLRAATAIATTSALRVFAQPTFACQQVASDRDPPVGVHIAAHSFHDEGIEHCLDFLKETAGVNMLFVTSNSYYGAMFRPKEAQGYHGVPIRDGRDRKVTRIFFKPDEKRYAKTTLRHKPLDPPLEYAG